MLRYQEFLPHPALRDYVNLYGVLEDQEHYSFLQVETNPPVINKGLMFHYRRDQSLEIENAGLLRGELPRGFLMAQGIHPNTWFHRGGFGIFAIVFKPGRFRFFYPDSMLEFLDGLITFEAYNELALLELYEQIVLARSHEERIQHADRYLLRKLINCRTETTDWLSFAIQKMYRDPDLSIQKLSREVGKSTGYFRRRFTRELGISPKSLHILMRMTHVIHYMENFPEKKLTEIAYRCGFSDQAHFNHTFKQYTKLTPMAYRKSQDQLIAGLIAHHEPLVHY